MPTTKVMLTGEALLGIDAPRGTMAVANPLPQEVCLGRQPLTNLQKARFANKAALVSRAFNASAANLPETVDYSEKAMESLNRMYMNDQEGCCVFSSKGHMFGVLTANDDDSPGVAVATDQEIHTQYRSVCGPGDNGCNIEAVFDYLKRDGMLMNGVRHKIDEYVPIDHTNKDLVKAAIYAFGNLTLGINLPNAWLNAAIWDTTSTRIVGGHDVQSVGYSELPQVVGYTAAGVKISSWGRTYIITWAAFLSNRWIDEAYVCLAPDWYGKDNVASSVGFDLTGLKAALAQIKSGQVPDVEPPQPPLPGPPDPPSPGPAPAPVPTVFPNYVGTARLQTTILGQKVDATLSITLKPQS